MDYKIEPARCEGAHAFEDVCHDCGAARPNEPCAVCPHMPWEPPSAHWRRNPCRSCGSINLHSVRVRAPIGG